MKTIVLVLLGLTVFQASGACMCAGSYSDPQGVENAYAQEDAIFVGRVERIEAKSCREAIIRFSAKKVYKGDRAGTVDVFSHGALYQPSCFEWATDQFVFEQGKIYLVYANQFEGKFYTSGCSRTRELSESGKDVQLLEEILAEGE